MGKRAVFWTLFVLILMVPFYVLHIQLARLIRVVSDKRPRLVLLVTLDTTRPDRLGAGGNARALTPHLDRFLRRAVSYESAWCPLPITNPSHCSLMTGLDAHRHGVFTNGYPLGEEPALLAETLTGLGYRTAAFISGFSLIQRISGLARGFEVYDDAWSAAQVERFAPETTAAALAWADSLASGERAFLWVHYFDPHHPYAPQAPYDQLYGPGPEPPRELPPEVVERYRRIEADAREKGFFAVISKDPMATTTSPAVLAAALAGYDGELALMDAWFGRLMTGLAARGLLADALVVVAGDHGEGFDHDYYYAHGDRVYESALRVPMAVWSSDSDIGPRLDDLPVGAVDLMPTILDRCGVLGSPAVDGRKLELAQRSIERGDLELAWARAPALDRPGLSRGAMTAVRGPRWKLIHELAGDERWLLYDLASDPGETENLWGREALLRLGYSYQGHLRDWEGRASFQGPPERIELDEEARAGLQALGYVK